MKPSHGSLQLQTPVADNPNMGRNIHQREDDLATFDEDFSQPALDYDEEKYDISDTNVSLFHINPPPS